MQQRRKHEHLHSTWYMRAFFHLRAMNIMQNYLDKKKANENRYCICSIYIYLETLVGEYMNVGLTNLIPMEPD